MVKFENAHREQMETVRTTYGTHGKACGLSLSWTTWKLGTQLGTLLQLVREQDH
jgi:hypothetical protein